MLKTVKLALNSFPTMPSSLLDPATGQAVPQVGVELADLYHQFYVDTYAEGPPDPNRAHFEHAHHLMPCQDFRFKWNGLGVNKTAKASASNRLGQAFCRWLTTKKPD